MSDRAWRRIAVGGGTAVAGAAALDSIVRGKRVEALAWAVIGFCVVAVGVLLGGEARK